MLETIPPLEMPQQKIDEAFDKIVTTALVATISTPQRAIETMGSDPKNGDGRGPDTDDGDLGEFEIDSEPNPN